MPLSKAINIENASWRDLGELRSLEAECFGDDAWPLWDLIGALTLPGYMHLKAVSPAGRMIGFISGDPRPGEHTGWITTIGVLKAFRRQGIGEMLLEECERRMGLPYVRLCVRRDNQPALQMYKKAGYHQISVWREYYNDGQDAIVLEKER